MTAAARCKLGWLLALLGAGCSLPLPDLPPPADGGADAAPWRWHEEQLPQLNTLHGLWGANQHDVWAVGNAGLILHRDASGWSEVQSPTTAGLNAICGGAQPLWAVGDGGAILRHDGAWQTEASPVTRQLDGLWCAAGRAWAVGAAGTLLHHDGSSWSASSEGTDDLRAVWGSAADDIWAVGTRGTILHHDGSAWLRAEAITDRTLIGVWGRSATEVFAGAAGGALLRYHGGGEWTRIDVDTTVSFRAIAGRREAGETWAVGDRDGEGVVFRLDGPGASWLPAGTLPDGALHAVWVAPSGRAWAVGNGGEALRYGP